jgi:tellurite methyltransferase
LTRSPNPSIQRWNYKHQQWKDHNGSLVEPAGEPELVEFKSCLDGAGLALELACGRGQNALFLAALGYEVVACDGASSALEICHRSAKKLDLVVSPLVCDLEKLELPSNKFKLISIVRYLYRPIFDQLKTAVCPGGLIFYKTFNSRFLKQKPGFNPDYVVEFGELNDVFSGFEILATDFSPGCSKSASLPATSFILARRPETKV